MKSRLLVAAMTAAVACPPMIANAAGVDCGGSAPCTLPFDTVVAPGTPLVTLKLDNGAVPWTIASDSAAMVLGQTLGLMPFVIISGAPANSLKMESSGSVAMFGGQSGSATASLHVKRTTGAKTLVENTANVANPSSPAVMFELRRKGAARFDIADTNSAVTWTFQNRNGTFDISKVGTGVQEFSLDGSGNLTIQGALTQLSDASSKHDFQAVDGSTVLAEINRLPISKWRYKSDATGSQHIGPTAQDFYSVFNVGINEKSIAPLDVASVAVAGVKELSAVVAEQKAALAAKDAQLAEMNQRMTELEDSMNRLLLTMQHAQR